jgi:hypothetical protein
LLKGNNDIEKKDKSMAESLSITEVFDTYSDALQRASNYMAIEKWHEQSGTGAIISGIAAIIFGIIRLRLSIFNAILVLMGISLNGLGIRTIHLPLLKGMITNGLAFIIIGIWNIIVTLTNMMMIDNEITVFIVVGIVQIAWGFYSFVLFARFSKMPKEKPSSEILKLVDDLNNEIVLASFENDARIMDFKIEAFFGKQDWKGRLDCTSAVFVEISRTGRNMMLARKDSVLIQGKAKNLFGKTLKAAFKIGDRNLKGTISPESFDRYEKWKSAVI